jgi:hypothetical protein
MLVNINSRGPGPGIIYINFVCILSVEDLNEQQTKNQRRKCPTISHLKRRRQRQISLFYKQREDLAFTEHASMHVEF